MNILEFLKSEGTETKANGQGEYSSACPFCGGNDRFSIWLKSDSREKDGWWCRQCRKSGDLIDLVRLFRGLSFSDACRFIGEENRISTGGGSSVCSKSQGRESRNPRSWQAKPAKGISAAWLEKAESFIQWSHEQLLKNSDRLEWLQNDRGINLETVKQFKLGWNPKDFFRDRQTWGLPEEVSQKTGKPKKLYLPSGLVIPGRDFAGKITRLKIRIAKPKPEQPKYYFLPGGSAAFCFFGESQKAFIVVESELDAILLAQESENQLSAISTGSASTRPDSESLKVFTQADNLIISLDNDEAGAKAGVNFWAETFNNARSWFIPPKYGKDHTAAFLSGFPLAGWLKGIIQKQADESARIELEAHQRAKECLFDSESVDVEINATAATESQALPLPETSTGQIETTEPELLIVEAVRLAVLSDEANRCQIDRALNTLDFCKAGTDDYEFALSVLVTAIEDTKTNLSEDQRSLAA